MLASPALMCPPVGAAHAPVLDKPIAIAHKAIGFNEKNAPFSETSDTAHDDFSLAVLCLPVLFSGTAW